MPFNNNTAILYSNQDHKRIKSLLTVQLIFMASMGQTPNILNKYFPSALLGLGRLLMYLYSAFVVWNTLHTCLLFIKTTVDVMEHGQLNEITDALTQVIICAFSCFSTCYWLWHAKALSEFICLINRNYWHQSLVGLTYVSFYAAYAKARRITFYWLLSTSAGVVCWGLAPLLQGSHTLPLRCWYPFDPLESWIYPWVYAMQMFTQLNIGISYGCGSALYVSLIILMLGQFDVLFCSLKNLQYHAQLMAGEDLQSLCRIQADLPKPKDVEVNQYLFVKEEQSSLAQFENMFKKRSFVTSLNESFIKCIKLHRFICNCCAILEDLFYPYCLVKSLQITVQLCLLVFVGVAGERSPMRVFNLFQYAALTLMELVMFCFCGELLKQHSTRSGEALFRSQWDEFTPLLRRNLLIFLINSNRALRLTAGKFFVMDLERLRSVVTQAFSFLTLLQKLAAKVWKE